MTSPSYVSEILQETSQMRKEMYELKQKHKHEIEHMENKYVRAGDQLYRFGQLTGSMQEEIRDLKYQVNELLQQVEELLPFFIEEVEEGLKFGMDAGYHNDDGCPKCLTYRWAVLMKARLDDGDFGIVPKFENTSKETAQ